MTLIHTLVVINSKSQNLHLHRSFTEEATYIFNTNKKKKIQNKNVLSCKLQRTEELNVQHDKLLIKNTFLYNIILLYQ